MTLREARQRAGMTQAALSRGLGLTQAAVCAYEAGSKTPPAWRVPLIEDLLGAARGSIEWPKPVPKEASA